MSEDNFPNGPRRVKVVPPPPGVPMAPRGNSRPLPSIPASEHLKRREGSGNGSQGT